MNIGIFMDTYYPQVNGVVTSTQILKEELERLGHQVTIITIKHPSSQDNSPDIIHLPSIPFPLFTEHRIGAIYSYRAMRRIKRLNLDLIHTQTEFSIGVFGRIIAKILNIPVVHTYHTMYEDYMHYITEGSMKKYAIKAVKKASKIYCMHCNRIIAPTVKAKEALRSYGVKNQIDVIPTGIKLKEFKKEKYSKYEISELKNDLKIQEDENVVLFVVRLAKEKSVDLIIKEMLGLLQKLPKSRLLIIGDGPERDDLERLSRDLGIEDKVSFAGEQPWSEIGKYYQLGDLFVSASITETQGLTFIEAMAAQLPVVARYDTNLDKLLTDKVNGRFFFQTSDLSQILFEVLNNRFKTEALVKQAYQDVQEMSAENFGRRIEEVYYETLYRLQESYTVNF